MYCNFNYGYGCQNCQNFVKTTEVKGTADRLDLIIPARALCNNTTLCICIAQPIPADVTIDTPVFIVVGDAEYPVVTPCLNLIYADQVQPGRMYCFKFAVDTLGFIYKGGWRLCRTKHQFTCIPIASTPVKKSTIKKTPKSKAEDIKED